MVFVGCIGEELDVLLDEFFGVFVWGVEVEEFEFGNGGVVKEVSLVWICLYELEFCDFLEIKV